MKIEQISTAAGGRSNEDLIAVYESERFTDLLVMDGGTSVADRAYIDTSIGDAAWLVRSFAKSLGKMLELQRSQEESVMLAVRDITAEFRWRTEGVAVPLYAYPIAAMTWIRMPKSTAINLEIYSLGDCKAFVVRPDGSAIDLDPWSNPQELLLQAALGQMTRDGVTTAAARRERLLPILRARREFQNSSEAPAALCLDPRGPFDARKHAAPADPGSTLFAMTDGFYRLVDTYGLYSIEELAELCRRDGLSAAMQELRAFESAGAAAVSMSVKDADDASAITCLLCADR